jgi:hypothetical protein
MPLHAVSALKEAQVKWRVSYLIFAVLLTLLDGIVTVCISKKIWIASAGDLPVREPLVFFVALETTSLANVWIQCSSGLRASLERPNARPTRNVEFITVEQRGQSGV